MKRVHVVVLSAIFLLGLSGCGSLGKKLKSLLGGNTKKSTRAIASVPKKKRVIKFSENPNVKFNGKRKYRRMTKERFEVEAKVGSDSGSLWVDEGQGAYLFSQNQVRMVGDAVNVKLVGAAKEQLTTKVKVIQNLLRKIEKRKDSPFRKLASAKKKAAGKKNRAAAAGGEEANPKQAANKTPVGGKKNKDEALDKFKVERVPTRIVEKLPDGNYRVKGSQSFMIGKKEYKVIVTGLVRGEDYNDEGIDSSKLVEPKYDVVSTRRSLL